MVAPLTMAFLAGGGRLFEGLQARGMEKARVAMERMSRDKDNFNRQWQFDAAERNMLRQWEANLRASLEARALGNEFRAIQEVHTKLAYDNQRSGLSKQTQAVNGAMMASFSGRGISGESGTARALLRTNMENAAQNAQTLRQSQRNTERDISTQYENLIASLRVPDPSFGHFEPNSTAIADNSTGIFLAALAQGAASGTSAYLQNS